MRLSVHICRGVLPSFLMEVPSSFLTWGTPILPHRGGTPIPGQDGGGGRATLTWEEVHPSPSRPGMGVPQTWEGVPSHPDLGRVPPCPDLGRGTPNIQTWKGVLPHPDLPPVQVRFQDGDGIPNWNSIAGSTSTDMALCFPFDFKKQQSKTKQKRDMPSQ